MNQSWITSDAEGRAVVEELTNEQSQADLRALALFSSIEGGVSLGESPSSAEVDAFNSTIPVLPPLRLAHWRGEAKRIGIQPSQAKKPIKVEAPSPDISEKAIPKTEAMK